MNDGSMTQEELDALLKDLQAPESEPETQQEKEQEIMQDDLADNLANNFDIDQYLSSLEQDTLAEIGNISMGSAATALSTLVNRKVSITVPRVYLSTPATITSSYPIPCIVVNIGYVVGLEGSNMLVIREKDALVIGNLMMGEDGTNPPDELDEIYLSAVTEAMNMMMGSASTSMSELFGRMIDISPPSTSKRDLSQDSLTDSIDGDRHVVIVSFRMEIGDLVDSTILQIIEVDFAKDMARSLLPAEEPVQEQSVEQTPTEAIVAQDAVKSADDLWGDLRQTPVQLQTEQQMQPAMSLQNASNLENINVDLIRDIPVQVRAILGRTKMSIDNILRLGPGHIMELESLHGEPIELFANDTLVAKGEVVVVGEQFGVRITEIATPKDRIVSIS